MAGTLRINENSVWMPAGWVYDGILELVAGELSNQDPALAEELLQARTHAKGYHDLRTLDVSRFRLLKQATERAVSRAESQGARSFSDPTFYPGFMRHFNNLRALLATDGRAPGQAEDRAV